MKKKDMNKQERLAILAFRAVWTRRILIGLIVGLVILTAISFITDWTGPSYKFNKAVHSHMDNAYYSADPHTMKTEIELAVDGMQSLGLTPDMNGKFFTWEQTSDWSMAWQYTHIESVQIRLNEFIDWWNAQDTTSTGSQQFQDVFTQKLNNVRSFIKTDGGWSDMIAEQAFYLHSYIYYPVIWPAISIVLLALILISGGLTWFYNNKGLKLAEELRKAEELVKREARWKTP